MKKLTLAVATLALLLAGCTDGSGYGQGTDFGPSDGGTDGAIRSSSTVAPDIVQTPVTEPPESTTTTRRATTTTARPAPEGYPIKIQSDQATTQFEPRVAQVRVGTPVTFTNTDSVARSVEFADQSFLSGPIPPGGTATYTPARAGEFNYSDGTRPYAVGTLRVQPSR